MVIYTYQKSEQAVLSEQHGWQYKTNIVRVTVYLEGEVLLLCVVEAGWNVKVKYTGLLLIVVVYVVYKGKLDLTERIRNIQTGTRYSESGTDIDYNIQTETDKDSLLTSLVVSLIWIGIPKS